MASLKPCQKVCAWLPSQSSSPMSSFRRQMASWRSSSVSQVVVLGRSGKTKMAQKAMKMVTVPSIMNSHRHAAIPLAPSRLSRIPAAIKPEKAPDSRLPEYIMAERRANSFLVYHEDKKYKHPGKYAASTKPRKNRMANSPPKLFAAAVAADIVPQTTIEQGKYIDGLPNLFSIRFEGTCMSR